MGSSTIVLDKHRHKNKLSASRGSLPACFATIEHERNASQKYLRPSAESTMIHMMNTSSLDF